MLQFYLKAQLGCKLNVRVNMFTHQSILSQLMETPTTTLSLLNRSALEFTAKKTFNNLHVYKLHMPVGDAGLISVVGNEKWFHKQTHLWNRSAK